jgi:3-oxoacyl-(acyl-carrier-protein) synthase
MQRVVVTGLGAITPLAAGVEASCSRLLAGRSGIRKRSGLGAILHDPGAQGSRGTAELI